MSNRSMIRKVSGENRPNALIWFQPWTKVKEGSFEGDVRISWFSGGKLNVSYNCLDRHLAGRGDQIAILWEGDDPAVSRSLTYRPVARRGEQVRQRTEVPGAPAGRSRDHLSADDPRTGGSHAGLHPHRRCALHRVRRLLTRTP